MNFKIILIRKDWFIFFLFHRQKNNKRHKNGKPHFQPVSLKSAWSNLCHRFWTLWLIQDAFNVSLIKIWSSLFGGERQWGKKAAPSLKTKHNCWHEWVKWNWSCNYQLNRVSCQVGKLDLVQVAYAGVRPPPLQKRPNPSKSLRISSEDHLHKFAIKAEAFTVLCSVNTPQVYRWGHLF